MFSIDPAAATAAPPPVTVTAYDQYGNVAAGYSARSISPAPASMRLIRSATGAQRKT